MDWKIILEFLIVLAAIALGARAGGIGFGLWGAVGLTVMTFVMGLSPGEIPVDVLFIILAAVTAAAVMEAAGGLDYLVSLAERAIRAYPQRITIVAPLVTWLLTFLSGTGHIVYPLLPVIEEVALEHKIRVERPMAIAAVASQTAITASPVSAATAALIGILAPLGLGLKEILLICIPSTLTGVIVAALIQMRVGKELEQDPEYLRRLAAGEIVPRDKKEPREITPKAKASVALFLIGIALIVIVGLFPELRPVVTVENKQGPLPMPLAIEILMLSIAAVMMVTTRVKADSVLKTSVARAGFTAIIAIFGLCWLGNTFLANNKSVLAEAISSITQTYPILFALALYVSSILLYSQAATAALLMPLGVSLGIPPELLIAMFPALNGLFFLPNYGSAIAAVSFDRTGTTRIGKWGLNHSFLLPGLVATWVSVAVGVVLGKVLL